MKPAALHVFVKTPRASSHVSAGRPRLVRHENAEDQADPSRLDILDVATLHSIFEASTDCIKVLDLDGVLYFCMNEGGAFGHGPERPDGACRPQLDRLLAG